MSVLEAVRTYFPQLSSFADDRLLAAIERSAHYVNTEQWGGSRRADYARALLAAHFLTAPDGPAVSARSGGGISETYAITDSSSWLSSTAYGAEFLELQRRTVPQRFRIAPLPYTFGAPWRGGWPGGWHQMPSTGRRGALDELLRYLRNANKAARDVYIGVHADDAERKPADGEDETPPNNAQVAATHEFGIGVPERSFLRSTIRAHHSEYKSLFASELRRNLRSAYADAERPYHVVGNKAVSDVRAAMTRGIEPELSEETLERRRKKGFPGTTPLIETGQLKSSIAYSVGKPGKDDSDA